MGAKTDSTGFSRVVFQLLSNDDLDIHPFEERLG